MVALCKPKESWVARWQRITEYVPGMYCVKVNGELPENVEKFLEHNNSKHPRWTLLCRAFTLCSVAVQNTSRLQK